MADMNIGQPTKSKPKAGECRRCQSFCDKLIDPAAFGTLLLGCPYLYS